MHHILTAIICKYVIIQEWLLTVYSMEGVGIFFVGSLWSADDLQHGALRLGGLRRQGVVVWILLSVCLWTADRKHNQLEILGG